MKFLNLIHCGVLLIGAVALILAAPHSELSLESTNQDDYEYINENLDNEHEELIFANETENDVEEGASGSNEELEHFEPYMAEHELKPHWNTEDCDELCKLDIPKLYPLCDKWCKDLL